MTFHDEIEHNLEQQAHKSAQQLVLYLRTVAPVKDNYSENLIEFAKALGWATINDKMLGELIK